MIRIPYGLSNFQALITGGFYYVDKTEYIEQIERFSPNYLFLLRPRRFGKSLFISMLHHYYGIEYQDQFHSLFGHLSIGKNPTSEANQYFVLRFRFAGVVTTSLPSIHRDFFLQIYKGVQDFLQAYSPSYFSKQECELALQGQTPHALLANIFHLVKGHPSKKKLYVLIDEYDYFANSLLAKGKSNLSNIVGRGSFFRTFFEELKSGTEDTVGRIFVTGVSPLTLDGLTSGFNIASNISSEEIYHGILGFYEKEVKAILQTVGVPPHELPNVLTNVRFLYDGYRFSPFGEEPLYNPNMVLYFAQSYLKYKRPPRVLLDTNIASDYGRIKELLLLGNPQTDFLSIIEKILNTGSIRAEMTQIFNFERGFTNYDFISLLYYMGLLTIRQSIFYLDEFVIPNYVIKSLYFDFFQELLTQRASLPINRKEQDESLYQLAMEGNPIPIIQLVEALMVGLSNRDSTRFDEKHLKTIFYTLLNPAKMYNVHSEYEINRQYLDLFLEERQGSPVKYQYVFELKYLKKVDQATLPKVKTAAIAQLTNYLSHKQLSSLHNLKAYIIIFVGTHAKVIEELPQA